MQPLITPEFRVSYPKIFKPELNKLSNKMEYSLVALFPLGADLSRLKAAAKAALTEKWGADQTKWPKNLKLPFRDQGERIVMDKETNQPKIGKDGQPLLQPGHVSGAVFLNLKSQQKPGVVDQQVQPIIDDTQFYGGCYAMANISCYAYDQAGNRGVGFGLSNVQKTRDGEAFGGRTRPEDAFKPVAVPEGEAATGSATDVFEL